MTDHLAILPKTLKLIGLAADHGAYELKQYLVGMLREAGHEVIDVGDRQPKPEDDHPGFVVPLARAVAGGEVDRGVAIRHGETEWSLSGQHSGHANISLTGHGEAEARAVGQRLRNIPFAHVLTSPLQRAQQTCALAALGPTPQIEPDLAEWDNGDDEGRTSAESLKSRPGWNRFRDGSPNGETPAQISDRADRLIAQVCALPGNVALFSHSHFGRVLAARWVGWPVAQAQHLLLNTGSVSVLCYEHERTDQPAIALWNSVAPETFDPASEPNDGERNALKRRAIDRWENEGGEIPNGPIPQSAATSAMRSPGKKLFIFDLDGTLAESKAALDAEMAALLKTLLGQVKVAVISGGDWPQFETQLLANLSPDANLKNLSLLPTCGTKFYQFDSDWQQLYAEHFTKAEKEKIIRSLEEAVGAEDFGIQKTWGEQIEDRGSQITFSALGQRAPLEQKEKWDADFTKRKKIKTLLQDLIPDFTVRLGGTTSIDVTKLGIDKAYGIKKLREILGIELEEMLFAGDALFPGGNDYPVKAAGVVSIRVNNAEETKRVIETFLAS